MKMLASLAVIGIAGVCSVQTSYAMSAANCNALWNRADTNDDGALIGRETSPYVIAMTDAEIKPVKTDAIFRVEFMKACEDGAFRNMLLGRLLDRFLVTSNHRHR
jgi:hypothetical protein